MNKFPEAFERFEKVVDTRHIPSFQHLRMAFRSWAGQNWKGTTKQMTALKVEALKRGIPIPVERKYSPPLFQKVKIPDRSWIHEVVTVKGKAQNRFRDLKTGRFVKNPFLKAKIRRR